MDYKQLLEGVCEMGYQLLGCGAEIPRVEDTVRRIALAYGVSAEVFAIPNCLIVSIVDKNGEQLTRMRQAKFRSIDILRLEAYNALSRRLCANPPEDTGEVLRQVNAVTERMSPYPAWLQLIGYFIGASFFALFFSGGLMDALLAGLAGVVGGACALWLGTTRSNFFINTAVSGFVLALTAYGGSLLGLPVNLGPTMAGAIMVLVPGLVFTNFMSDLLTGDVMAGLSSFARAVLTAGAIALGTGSAVALLRFFTAVSMDPGVVFMPYPLLACPVAFIACLGFCLPFNIRGIGMLLCCLGGAVGWLFYLLMQNAGANVYLSTFVASVVVSIYSESMARLRKCPTTSYLVVSYFPLVPGFTIYTAMTYGIAGDIDLFLATFLRTFGIAACIAMGTLMVSTALRIWQTRRRERA